MRVLSAENGARIIVRIEVERIANGLIMNQIVTLRTTGNITKRDNHA